MSPALKAFGVGGRPRLFEVVQRVREVNYQRRKGLYRTYQQSFGSTPSDSVSPLYPPGSVSPHSSTSGKELAEHPDFAVDYIVAPPRMAKYIEYSTRVYRVYLRYIAPEDIHTYSIDEVFIDATAYLKTYRTTAHELAMKMIREVLAETGVTATAGIGTNMYLAKIAMDIVAKKMPPDKDGVRIAELDEMSYRRKLWNHEPLTSFWRVGKGIAKRLAQYGIYTMGDIALMSHRNEDFLYKLFGVNAELLIDHAWGWEPVTMDLVKAYKPETHSISSGQVLQSPYTFAKARNVILEMADAVSLDLIDKRLVTSQIVLQIGYDVESLTRPEIREKYRGPVKTDTYGREVPQHAHGTINIATPTSSATILIEHVATLFDRIVNPDLLVRRLTINANKLVAESDSTAQPQPRQLDLFADYEEEEKVRKTQQKDLERERRIQEAALRIKQKFGKNAILKGLNYTEGATQRDRNSQIGGHHS